MASTKKVETFKMGGKYGMTSIPVTRTEVTCDCGEVFVVMQGLGDGCPNCDQWYNFDGQEIRPPRDWGEETGERFDDSGNYIGGGDDI